MSGLSSQSDPGSACENCVYGPDPLIVLETGHLLSPQVQIWQCRKCHHAITRPPIVDVSRLYENRGSEDFLTRDGPIVRRLKMTIFRRLARNVIANITGPLKTIADYGTGSGMIAMAMATESGLDTTVYAIDFFESPPGDLGRVKYVSLDASSALRGQVDLLTCFHVLEHSNDPREKLDELRSYLRPGGTLVIEVPNVDCVWTPWFGKFCANWYAPYHRVHFSRDSLVRLARSEHFDIVSLENICGPTFALSLANLLRVRPNGWLFAIAAVLRPLQWLAEHLSGQPSALRITLRN